MHLHLEATTASRRDFALFHRGRTRLRAAVLCRRASLNLLHHHVLGLEFARTGFGSRLLSLTGGSHGLARDGNLRGWKWEDRLTPNALIDHLQDALWVPCPVVVVVLLGFLTVIEENLIKDKLSQDLLVKGVLLELKVEILNASTFGLVLRLVKVLEVGMRECIGGTQSLSGIVAEKSLHQIKGILLDSREEFLEADTLSFLIAVGEEVANSRVLDLLNQLSRRKT